MFLSISSNFSSFFKQTTSSTNRFLFSEQTYRIKQATWPVFSKISDFFQKIRQPSNQINIEAVAMIGFLTVITLVVIAMIRSRDTNGHLQQPRN